MNNAITVNEFIKPFYQDKVEQVILSQEFPWYYGLQTSDPSVTDGVYVDGRTKDCSQFTHTFYGDGKIMSKYWSLVEPFLPVLQQHFGNDITKSIVRIKANLMLNNPNYPLGCYNTPHIDEYKDAQTALYYVNNSDGDTVMFQEKVGECVGDLNVFHRVAPEKGKLLLFNSTYLHASTPPRVSQHRAVINFVFKK